MLTHEHFNYALSSHRLTVTLLFFKCFNSPSISFALLQTVLSFDLNYQQIFIGHHSLLAVLMAKNNYAEKLAKKITD